jgi:competence protein ComEA
MREPGVGRIFGPCEENPMLKKILAFVVMLYAAASFAAVDANKATAAELDGLKGIGPAISAKIIDERKKGSFKDWQDFIDRVKGVGENNAVKFSAEGLTVNGATFKGVAATPAAARKEAKADAKAEKKEAKADAKSEKAVAKADKQETKAKADAKADKAIAKADAKADKKEAKADAKAEKAVAKADAAKPAASAAKK